MLWRLLLAVALVLGVMQQMLSFRCLSDRFGFGEQQQPAATPTYPSQVFAPEVAWLRDVSTDDGDGLWRGDGVGRSEFGKMGVTELVTTGILTTKTKGTLPISHSDHQHGETPPGGHGVGTGGGLPQQTQSGGKPEPSGEDNVGEDNVGEDNVGEADAAPPALPSVVVGIPTVPRPRGVSYLQETLQAVLSQIEEQPATTAEGYTISILVMDVHGGGHRAFESARVEYKNTPGVSFLSIGQAVDQDGADITVGVGEPLTAKASANRKALPSFKVRKQTRDLVYLLRAAAGRADHYLFMEDDMRLCSGGVAAIGRMLHKAHSYDPEWIAVRASFGMNGIIVQAKDVLPFASYLEAHQDRRPPDHLVVEWFAGEIPASREYKGDRKHMAFRYNIFEHLGSISTLRGKLSPAYPRCFEQLDTRTLFEVEAFDPERCPSDDLSPCDVPDITKKGFPAINWSVYGKN